MTDPISLGIGAITAFEAVTGASVGFEFAGLVGNIIIGASLAGAQYALNATQKKPAQDLTSPAAVNINSVLGNTRQSTPSQRIIYGNVRTGGAYYFIDDSKPPALYLGILYSSRPITAFRRLFLSDQAIPFATIPDNQVVQPLAATGQSYISGSTCRLFACFRSGNPGQTASALLLANFATIPSSFICSGIATAEFKCLYGTDRNDFETTWGQVAVPDFVAEVAGAPVYDPRDPSQRYVTDWRDSADVADAMATWTYSNTAALVQADWLGWPAGVNHPPDRIDWDKVAASATWDEAPVANKDGSVRKRHLIDGVVTLDESPRTIMEAMLTANRGFLVQHQGRGWLQSSQPRSPVATISDRDMVGPFEFRDARATRDLVNRVTTKFVSSDRNYQDTDGPVLDRTDLQDADGELLQQSVRLPFTSDQHGVQALSKEYVEESRLGRSWTGPVHLRKLGLKTGDCVRIASDLFPRMSCLYTIDKLGYPTDFSAINLALNEYDPTIATDWNAQTDEQPFSLPIPTDVSVVSTPALPPYIRGLTFP